MWFGRWKAVIHLPSSSNITFAVSNGKGFFAYIGQRVDSFTLHAIFSLACIRLNVAAFTQWHNLNDLARSWNWDDFMEINSNKTICQTNAFKCHKSIVCNFFFLFSFCFCKCWLVFVYLFAFWSLSSSFQLKLKCTGCRHRMVFCNRGNNIHWKWTEQ